MEEELMPNDDPLAHTTQRWPVLAFGLLGLVALSGALTFMQAIDGPASLRAWQIFLVNFLFWTGISQAGVVFSAVLYVTGAQWGKPIRRIAEGMVAFLPLSVLLFPLLVWGLDVLFPWVHGAPGALHGAIAEERALWLHAPFHVARDGIALLLLAGLSLVFVYHSLAGRERTSRILSPILLILYAVVYTLLAFDLVMALDSQWISTLFGGYFFIGNFYAGLAAIAIATVLMRRCLHLEERMTLSLCHDLGKLIFGFSLLSFYLFWSQYLTIWYGNLPEETEYIIVRVKEPPWVYLSWAVLLLAWAIPFLVLLSRNTKRNPLVLSCISGLVVIGMWLERYVLVVPSLWHAEGLPLGWIEPSITLSFLAAMLLMYLGFWRVLSRPPPGIARHP
ncbi:MAG: polysulfide reductase NrfD [Nitrospinae bacterium]|nr:polysulfide reductase NrfD [Nitrospinota bacterium]